MNKYTIFTFLLLLTSHICHAQMKPSDWYMEAESDRSSMTFLPDGTMDIVAPKGITVWHKSKMSGNVTIEYDAQIVVNPSNKEAWNRLSDLNCFWMATDPEAKNGNVTTNAKKRKGIFANQYGLQLYYLGYGGNHNSTTRFRRYNGDKRGIEKQEYRPDILREYTDENHLLKPNHWYHIRLEQISGHIRYIIDNICIVDYLDISPFTSGYFGFRTTLSHSQLRNFKYTQSPNSLIDIPLHWVGSESNTCASPQTFGVPFTKGEITKDNIKNLILKTDKGITPDFDSWTLARWDDGSVKWQAFASVIPAGTKACTISVQKRNGKNTEKGVNRATQKGDEKGSIILNAGSSRVYISRRGSNVIDSIVTEGKRTMGKAWLELNGTIMDVKNVDLEQSGNTRSTVCLKGDNFIVRLYAYKESNEIKLVHTFIVDSVTNKQGINSLGLRMKVSLQDEDHKRFVSFAKNGDKEYMHMSVKPLIARRPIIVDKDGNTNDKRTQKLIDAIASWDGFRLSQLSPNAYSIRKRATSLSPWIGTIEGQRSPGFVTIGDTKGCVSVTMSDFWQSYPSTLQVDDARSNEATLSAWMWSPESERMSFEHYDTIPHTLEAAYEDIQEGMSTAYGIARTTTLYINTSANDIHGEDIGSISEKDITPLRHQDIHLLPVPTYLHSKKAFGVWSLPESSECDNVIDSLMNHYSNEIERQAWYGYFNYGDVMHTYDRSRDEWRYDVGGYAWDNTELGTNAMFWYTFLRTGDPKVWTMAEAMARHTAEVDCYHIGPNAGLGTRHNVSHWGCGAKEARISQAFWNRFLYYLTADERSGDLMTEVKDADLILYTLDPMRLAQPRSLYTCTAPARLRIGPDWLAYAGNWFTEWERTGNDKYIDKVNAGINSISTLPHGIFSGPKALGYDPATGVITWEGDSTMQNTNHLLSIMGGFEMMNEMMLTINNKKWSSVWLDHAANYKEKALLISGNKFRIPRLKGYAYWKTGKKEYLKSAYDDLMKSIPFSNKSNFFTNDAATWTLDAIFLQEVAKEKI